jgi:predicted GNAT family acetyltransferase
LVAFGKLTRLAPGQWWLEGLRVAPEHQGRGLARRLHEHAVALADEMGSGALRFMTSSKTKPVHKIAADSGFSRILQLLPGKYPLDEPEATVPTGTGRVAFTPVEATPSQIQARLEESPLFAAHRGLIENAWVVEPLLPQLEALRENGRLFWWRADVLFPPPLAVIAAEPGERLWLNFLDAPLAHWPALLGDLVVWAAEAGHSQVRYRPPDSPGARRQLAAAGWPAEPGVQLWVYERPLPTIN